MIKAIAMDMDGTLLNEKEQLPPLTKEKLTELERQGVKLILASGRSYTRLMPYAKQLEMAKHGGWLLEVDGVAIYDLANMERHKERTLSPEEIAEVYAYLMGQYCEVQACFDDGLFAYYPPEVIPAKEAFRKENGLPEDYPWTAGPWNWCHDLRGGYPKQTFVKSPAEIDRPVNKLQIMTDADKLQPLFDKLVEKFGDRFEVFRTTPRQLEVLPKGFSKGEGLKRIMEIENWKPEEIMVFGDGENDVSMFEVTPNSYAMGNAAAYVQEKANHVIGSNREEGIFHALEKEGL